MSLTPCTECGNQISEAARACPQCGAPPRERRYKKWGYIFAAPPAILAILIIGYGVTLKAGGPEGLAMDNTVEQLKKQMKDPGSMEIRSSQTFVESEPGSQNRRIYICGLVDGKNSFGAYSGAVRFVSYSVSMPGAFDTISVTLEDPAETAQAREVEMRSGFEKVYWDPHCEKPV